MQRKSPDKIAWGKMATALECLQRGKSIVLRTPKADGQTRLEATKYTRPVAVLAEADMTQTRVFDIDRRETPLENPREEQSVTHRAPLSPQTMKVVLLATAVLMPHPNNRNVSDDDLVKTGLLGSIKKRGVIVPLIVRALPGGRFEVIAGCRRLRCLELLGETEAPSIVMEGDVTEERVIETEFAENEIRKNLTLLELAEKVLRYKHLVSDGGKRHVTNKEIAERLGIDASRVTWALSVRNKLAPDLRPLVESLEINASLAYEAAKFEKLDDQRDFVRRCREANLNRDQGVLLARSMRSGRKQKKPKLLKGKLQGRTIMVELKTDDTAEGVADVIKQLASRLLKQRDVPPAGWKYHVFSESQA